MAPVLRDRFLAVLDQTQCDPSQLAGHMVGVQEGGRVSVKWLSAESRPGHWVLHSENPQFADVVVKTPEADFLIGAVISWWGLARGGGFQRSVASHRLPNKLLP
jgi:hypothetical protein